MPQVPMRLLIVDKDEDDRELLSSHFTDLGYETSVATNGRQALTIVRDRIASGQAQPFDLVLLDISRLGEDNYRALEQLRGDPSLGDTPVIVTATADGIGDAIKCIDVGAKAGVVLKEKVSKMERDLEIGRQIQADFLPYDIPQPDGWEVATHFDPAREVAGDFYDVINLPRKMVGLVVGDVCDKGVGPAMFMSLSRSLLRVFSEENRISRLPGSFFADMPSTFNVSDEVRRMLVSTGNSALLAVELTNDYIANHHGDMTMFFTVFFGVLDPATGALTYISGGHEPTYVIGANGGVRETLMPTGPAVGLDTEFEFGVRKVVLEPGECVLAYSDGVPDAENPSAERFGKERLVALLDEPASSAEAMLERIRVTLWDHIGTAHQFDDITMLAARRLNSEEA